MRPASLAGTHESLQLASAAFRHRIELSRWPLRRPRKALAHYIVAKHAVDSELALLDGAIRTLDRGLGDVFVRTGTPRVRASAGAP
jgi:hypothetical protein